MKKTDVIKFIEILKETYPDATCSLDFETPFQMVVAVMLSAQCTDERVNKTTSLKDVKPFRILQILILKN